MTNIKGLSDRVCKISISLDPELVNYLDELEESRSEIIRKAIVDFRAKQHRVFYARFLRALTKHTVQDCE
jgi:metal-responsive CopG/Arc/MetJ family transcriptional regulator